MSEKKKPEYSVKYIYTDINFEEVGKKVLNLRRQYPNNQKFGDEVDKFLMSNEKHSTFPDV